MSLGIKFLIDPSIVSFEVNEVPLMQESHTCYEACGRAFTSSIAPPAGSRGEAFTSPGNVYSGLIGEWVVLNRPWKGEVTDGEDRGSDSPMDLFIISISLSRVKTHLMACHTFKPSQ